MKNSLEKIGCIALLITGLASSGEYYSNNIFEPDKVAFVWMIKTYVDKDAVFYFLIKGEVKEGAIPFDLPNAKYRRYPKYSTTMSLVKFKGIKDKKAIKLASLIDEIELNGWTGQSSDNAKKVEQTLRNIFESEKDPQKIIQASDSFFDALLDSL